MADEDLVIRRRLLTRTSALGKTGLKKCAESMLTLLEAFADESVDPATSKHDIDTLFWEMEQLEFEANKTDIGSFTCQRELEAYETLNAEIDTSIEKVTKEIEELKTKVHVERTIRAYKEEYESIARVINELPSRNEIAAEIAVEKKRLSEATSVIEAVDNKLALRTKQFALLINTIQNLKATLDEDVAMEEEEQQKQEADAEDEKMEEGSQVPKTSPISTAEAGEEDEASRSPRSP